VCNVVSKVVLSLCHEANLCHNCHARSPSTRQSTIHRQSEKNDYTD
jgi:hypothetical protein